MYFLNTYISKFLLLIFVLSSRLSYSQKTVDLVNGQEVYMVNHINWRILKDSLSQYDISDIVNSHFNINQIDYVKNPDWNVATFWFKTTISNSSNNALWVFEVPDGHIDEIDFFFKSKKGLKKVKSGALHHFSQRDLQHKNFSFIINLDKGERGTVYLKVRSKNSYGTSFKLRSAHNFIEYSLNEYILLGVYYGVLILIMLHSIFVYLSIKKRLLLLYFGYVLLIGLKSLLDDGIGFQYLWSSHPNLAKTLDVVVPILLLIVFQWYAHDFLETKKRSYLRYLGLNILLGVYVMYYMIELVIGKNQYSTLIYTIPFIGIYINSILTYKEGYKPARFFVLAYTVLVLSFVIAYFKSIGAFSEGNTIFILLVYSLNIGFLIEVMILSVATGDKFRTLELEKKSAQDKVVKELIKNEELSQKVNRELEEKVKERTLKYEESNRLLQSTTEKMIEQSNLVNQMNLKLDLANRKLEKESKKIIEDRVHLKGIGFDEFVKIYPDDMSCYKFLRDLKWANGYQCPRCGNDKYCNGNGPYARKCSKCTYNESVKVNTIFKGLRFETVKAFYLVFLVIDSRGEISSYDLAEKLDLRQKTCWAFKKKLTDHIKKQKMSYDDCKNTGWTGLVVI